MKKADWTDELGFEQTFFYTSPESIYTQFKIQVNILLTVAQSYLPLSKTQNQ